MKNILRILPLLLCTFWAVNLSAAGKHAIEDLPTQSGDGTVDRYMAHGREVYRFVPTDKSLHLTKFKDPEHAESAGRVV